MNASELRIGDRVLCTVGRDTYTAYIIAKYKKTVRVRLYVSDECRTIAYSAVFSVMGYHEKTLPTLLPDLFQKRNHTFAYNYAITILQQYELTDWDIQIDVGQHLGRGGQCGHVRRVIALSSEYLVLAERWDIRDTVLHEVAHALVGPNHGHDDVWATQAQALGCSGERTHTVTMPKRWIKYCPNMHWVQTTNRRSLKKRRVCSQCRAQTQYERYSHERYAELQEVCREE